MGYSPWGHKESDMTELLGTHTPTPYSSMSPGWDPRVPASGSESAGALLKMQILRPQLDLLKENAYHVSQACRE